MLFNKVYIINLERKKDNLTRTFDQLAKVQILGNIPVNVVRAHDGREIDDKYLKNINASVFPHWKDPWFGRGITTGEIGCALSHNDIWKITGDDDKVLVIEDDVVLDDDFLEKCSMLEEELLNIDYEFLYLGRKAIFPEQEEKISENLLIPNYSYWTNGYILNKSGANKLLNTSYLQNIIPVDEYIPYLYGRANKMIERKFDYLTNLRAYAIAKTIVNPERNSFRESETEKSEPYVPSDREMEEFGKKIHVLTAATEKNDGLKLLEHSAKKYGIPIEVLGLDTEWTGGNKPRLDYAGGGQKINLLKEKLKEIDDDHIVLFTDAYDVIFNATINEIVDKFLKQGVDLVFAAETSCWPDRNLEERYPITGTPFRFLNSGLFIGYAKKIKEIITDPISDTDDDQLYYTHRYLTSMEKDDFGSIVLDSHCSIFQTSLDNTITKIDGNKSRFYNSGFKTIPCVIHGNGPVERKLDLQRASNHLIHLRNHYGYCHIERKNLNENDLPVIFLNLNINKLDSRRTIKNAFKLNYPKDKMILHFNLIKGLDFKISGDLLAETQRYKEFSMSKNNPSLENMNSGAMLAAGNFEFDYMFTVDEECEFNNVDIIQDLLVLNKDLVSPLLVDSDRSYSNIWPGKKEGLSDLLDSIFMLDYRNMLSRALMGCWIVPFVDKCFLVKKSLLGKIGTFYQKNKESEVLNGLDSKFPKDSIVFCANMIDEGIFMHVDNQKAYGNLLV